MPVRCKTLEACSTGVLTAVDHRDACTCVSCYVDHTRGNTGFTLDGTGDTVQQKDEKLRSGPLKLYVVLQAAEQYITPTSLASWQQHEREAVAPLSCLKQCVQLQVVLSTQI